MSRFAQCARRRRASDKKSWVSGVDNEFKRMLVGKECCHRSQLCPHGFAKHKSYGRLGTRNLPYASHDHCVWPGVFDPGPLHYPPFQPTAGRMSDPTESKAALIISKLQGRLFLFATI